METNALKNGVLVAVAITFAYLFGMEVGRHAERLERARFDTALALEEMRRAARAALENEPPQESSDPGTGEPG